MANSGFSALFLECWHRTLVATDTFDQYHVGEYAFCRKCGRNRKIINKDIERKK